MDYEARAAEHDKALEFARTVNDSGEQWKLLAYAVNLVGFAQFLTPRVRSSRQALTELPLDEYPSIEVRRIDTVQ